MFNLLNITNGKLLFVIESHLLKTISLPPLPDLKTFSDLSKLNLKMLLLEIAN